MLYLYNSFYFYRAQTLIESFFLANDCSLNQYQLFPTWGPRWKMSPVFLLQKIGRKRKRFASGGRNLIQWCKFIMFLHQLGMPWIWNFIIHYIFGGFGMYLLLRYLKQNKYSSFFGSSLFMISPYMVAYFVHGHGSQMMTSAYIPWIILYLFKIFKETNLINFSLLAILIGLQLQRGHIQIAYYTWMMMGLYVLFYIVKSIYSKDGIFFSKSNLCWIVSFILSISFIDSCK